MRILIVDDERVIADTLAAILARSGYESSTAYSGEEAIDAAIKLAPDIVLMDVVMGLMSGVVAGIMIRRSLPTCRVILFSGQAATVNLLAGPAAAGHTFELLQKPIDPQKLLEYLAKPSPLVETNPLA